MKLMEIHHNPHLKHYNLPDHPIQLQDFFGNQNPVEVEIGCGKGKFLLARAQASLDINFIGIDWARKWLNLAETRGVKKNLPNLIFLRTHAGEWVKCLKPQQVSVFHIYFPDPWPKKRHHKRRIFQPDFLKCLQSALIPGGLVEFATDHAGYWEHVQEVAAAHAHEWAGVTYGSQRTAYPEFKTNYEIKYAAQGRPLHYLEMRKSL